MLVFSSCSSAISSLVLSLRCVLNCNRLTCVGKILKSFPSQINSTREFKITTTATTTATSLNKRFNEQNNGSARAL